jgi:hypothetical protein
MKKILVLSTLLATSSAYAQAPQQQAPQLPAEYILKVTPAETDLISDGLQTQPFGKVFPLLNKLRSQVIEQQPKPVDPPKPAATDDPAK